MADKINTDLPNDINSKKSKFKIYLLIFIAVILILFFASKWLFKTYKTNSPMINKDQIIDDSIPLDHSRVTELKGIARPFSVKLDSNNNLYVSDFGEHNVKIYDSNLQLVKKIGGSGTEGGKFNMPHAVDFDSNGNIIITDYGNKRIQKFSNKGTFLEIFGIEKSLAGPATSYFDKDFNLYVSDFGSNSIVKYSENGTYIGWIGMREDGTLTRGWEKEGTPAQSSEPGGFYKVHAVKFDPKDPNIFYTIDTWNHRVQKFSKDGIFLGWIGMKEDSNLTNGWSQSGKAMETELPGGFSAPIALDFINGGELAILEYGNPRIQRFSREGKFLGWFGGTEDGGTTDGWKLNGLSRKDSKTGAFANAYDIRVYGNVMYVADTGNSRIQKIIFY